MLQPEHMADLILYVAKLPASVCINEMSGHPDLEPRLCGCGRRRAKIV